MICDISPQQGLPPWRSLRQPLFRSHLHTVREALTLAHCAVLRRSRMVYWILCLLGVATLLPWNVYITESEFFDIRVHVPPTYNGIADSCETAIVLVFQFV